MKILYRKIIPLILLLIIIWAQAESINVLIDGGFWQFRGALIQLTGLLTITLMVGVAVLALRIPLIERFTKGLDKSYHLHKWLGISTLICAVLHWLCIKAPKYAVELGVLGKHIHDKSLHGDPQSLYNLIHGLHHSAKSIGEWAFYAMLILGAIALLDRISYKTFRLSHKLMAVCLVMMLYHSAILIDYKYWHHAISYITLVIIIIGLFAACWSLFCRIGKRASYSAIVSDFSNDSSNQVTDLRLSVKSWKGHKIGQFAYLNFGDQNIHPFTIACADNSKGELRFLIKELGDFTSEFKYKLSKGQQIRVEGPYGRFNLNDQREQLWIAGGIGVAAFKAALQSKQTIATDKSITLYYCTIKPSKTLIDELTHEAKIANVNLKVLDGRSDPLLTVSLLLKNHEDLLTCSIWFCGPTRFSDMLKRDLKEIKYDLNLFHQEYFSMR